MQTKAIDSPQATHGSLQLGASTDGQAVLRGAPKTVQRRRRRPNTETSSGVGSVGGSTKAGASPGWWHRKAGIGGALSTPIPAPATALVVPVIGGEIPRSLTVVSSSDMLTQMANTLLKMEILREKDWTGELVPSVTGGLERWANQELSCGLLAHFKNYEITYTDNHQDFSIDQDRFRQHVHKESEYGLPLCGLGMLTPHYKSLDWEPVHQYLEEHLGSSAAWSVYGVLIRGLHNVVGCACPSTVEDCLAWWGCWSDEEGNDLAPSEFRQYFPPEVFKLSCDRNAMLKALELPACRHPESYFLGPLVEAALEVEEILSSGWEGHLSSEAGYYTEEAMGPYLGACIDWGSARFSEEGYTHVTRWFDDYNESNAQVYCDELVWRYPFQIGGREWSIERAFTALETSLVVLALCDKIVHCADGMVDGLGIEVRVRV